MLAIALRSNPRAPFALASYESPTSHIGRRWAQERRLGGSLAGLLQPPVKTAATSAGRCTPVAWRSCGSISVTWSN